jgi:proline racemase
MQSSDVRSTAERVIRSYRAVDYHVAGEPFRIVVDGAPEIPGASLSEQRINARDTPDLDAHRLLLSREPHGHSDMYGGFVYPAEDTDADLGVIFWHTEGYPPSCSHGSMAVAVWAVESGLVPSDPDGVSTVTMNVPAGRAVAAVRLSEGRVMGVSLEPTMAYPMETGVRVATSMGDVAVDLAFGGAVFASLPASALGLQVQPEHYRSLVAIGREIRFRLNDRELIPHPDDSRLTGVFGVLLYEDLGETATGLHERNMNVFNDGWVDRSPCAPATAARLAQLTASGRLALGAELLHESIVGSRFTARARPADPEQPGAVIAEVEGWAYRSGEHWLTLDARDPFPEGFLLRAGPVGPAMPPLRL